MTGEGQMILILIVLAGLGIRLWQLDILPGEMWGDVIEHYKLVRELEQGRWFYHYAFGGDGPLFSYLAWAVSRFRGLSFESLKLTSALIGTALIPVTYLLARSAWPNRRRVAFWAALLAAGSFWGITFSRQAKPYILVPVMTGLVLTMIMKKRWFAAGLLTGLGMYSQAAFWGVAGLTLGHWKMFIGFLLTAALLGGTVVSGKTDLSGRSYIGEKWGQVSMIGRFSGTAVNAGKSVAAIWLKGDGSYRHTVPGQAHLDWFSGILVICGLIAGIKAGWKREFKWLLTALILIQLPSWLDTANPGSSPNMGRTIGILPILIALAANGLVWLGDKITSQTRRRLFEGLVVATIISVNLYRYFRVYPQTLPNGNTAFSPVISRYLDEQLPQLPVRMIHCCWGEGGQPEPNAIKFQLQTGRDWAVTVDEDFERNPQAIKPDSDRDFIILTQPDEERFGPVIKNTYRVKNEIVLNEGEIRIARIYVVGID